MDWSTTFEQSLRQLSDMQRGIFNSWSATLPSTQKLNMPNFRDTFDNSLKFQEQVVKSSLELQVLMARLSIEAQKQFWESYFNMLRKP